MESVVIEKAKQVMNAPPHFANKQEYFRNKNTERSDNEIS
jgi:hypothetical protein